jgi:hypothetical protein
MSLTTDRNDPALTHGVDDEPVEQAATYLILSADERAKGFVRPVRRTYVHVGDLPRRPVADLTPEQRERYGDIYDYWEEYPEGSPALGRFWTTAQLERKACGGETTMALELAETYARDPNFYSGTFCVGCRMHRPVAEFVWDGTDERVGS